MAVSVSKSVWCRTMRLLLLGFWFAEVTGAVGQLPGPQPSYEGQNVCAISLIANPHRDLNPLYPFVTQKANSPYSTKEIAQSAAALKRAGNFPEVRVQVTPEVSGLRVSFLLEPAYYIGVLKFPGASNHFAYIRLLQAADFSEQEPYDPARISVAEKGLTDFFRRNGYFQATVHGEPEIDDVHEIVNLKFTVNMGKQARISSVKVVGPSPTESAKLLHSMRSIWARLSRSILKPGEPYRPGRISAAIRRMKGTLTKQHRLASSIHENEPQYDPDTNQVAVSFKVEVGPTVTVRTIGPRLTWIPFLAGREMKKLIPIYSEGAVDQELVEEGQRNLVDYFQKKGFNDARVEIDFKKQPDHISIVYKIDPGKKHGVDRISFDGNHAIRAETLVAQVTVRKSHFWSHGTLSQKLLKQSSSNIEALYRDRGYEQAKVTPRTVEQDGKIGVTFDIQEGPQTTVEDVMVTGNRHIPYDQLTAPKGFQLRAGIPFSPRKLADDQNRISAAYLDHGYLNAEVKTKVTRIQGSSKRVTVTYEITENQLVRVSDVLYLGQDHTRMSLLKKTTQLQPEAPMRRAQLLAAESRLYDLGIFDWASVGPRKPITDQTESMALVKLHEAKRNEITYGFGFEVSHRGGNVPTGTVALPGGGTIGLNGYQIAPSQSTFASPRGLIEYTRHNIRGLAETGTASLLLSRLDQKALASYSQPHFVGSQWKTLSTFDIERNSENPLFTATLGDLSFQFERLISHKANTRVQFRYDFNKTILSHILVPDLVLDRDRNVRLSTVSASLIKDTRDHPLDAHHGVFATVDLGITPIAFGSSANFARLFAQYAFFKPVHSVVLANSIRVGLASPFASSFVPTSELFFSGGGTTLRSFPIDEAGPQRLVPFCNVLQGQSGCVNVTVPVGGKQLFILNSEVRFPLHFTKALGGVVFYDGGNVYSAINFNNFVNNYTNTIGFGLRYATPIGPIRIDIGHNLNPVPGINPTQYYITIGQAF
ncbi:MAG TPA: POTRA domain-containing protein [Candidatus Sulfotelmatobacter sp.]|nr:POTRA domain-containing protein [Candidatus Sulfotelmatobacter sp.]